MAWFVIGSAALVAVLIGIYWRWARGVDSDIAIGAGAEWDRVTAQDPALLEGVDRATFEKVYRHVHFPRYPGYALAAFSSFILSLPISFGLLAGGLWLAEELGWTPVPQHVAQHYLVENGHMKLVTAATPEAAFYYVSDLGGFYYFFGILIVWIAIVTFFMRRFHMRRPGHLREELLRARS